MAVYSFRAEKGVKENSARYTSYPAGWFFCLPDLITFITTSSANKDFSLSFCGFKNAGIWWLQGMPPFQGLKSWAVNLLRLTRKSTTIYLIVFFGVISVDLPQTAPDEKDVGAYLLLSVSASASV